MNTQAELADGDDEDDPYDYDVYVPNKPKCNEHLVRDLMNYNVTGGLCQAFVMHAITCYAERVIADPPADSGLFNGEAWKRCAVDIKAKCDAFYGRHG